MDKMKVAKIIYRQINGPRMTAMVGAHNFVGNERGLSFKFKGSKKANFCKITLNEWDLYDVELKKIWNMDIKDVCSENNLYYDQLLTFFETETGLYTKL